MVKQTQRSLARRGISGRRAIDARLQSASDKAVNRLAKKLSRPQHITGRGGFWGDRWRNIKDLGRGIFNTTSEATKAIPRGTFAALGSNFGPMGALGGEVLSQLTGRGDYQVKKNSIVHAQVGPEGMSFSPEGSASVRIQKREFLGVLTADAADPSAFRQMQYRLQGTDPKSYPWMSGIAQHFTEWELMGAIISYESTSSNYSSSMALGTVAIATQYNANELPYSDMTQMLQAAFHTRGNPSEDLIHGIECDPSLQVSERLFTRRPGAKGGPNLYDHGVVTVATEGLPSAAAGEVIGRIYITYDVVLSIPALPIAAPFAGLEGVASLGNVLSTSPPLGASLSIAGVPGSPLSFGQVAGDNVLLLQGATGPVVQPVLEPAQENNLLAWINDSTLATDTQYVTFARAGRYLLRIGFSAWSPTGDPGADSLVVTDVGDISHTLMTYPVSNNASYGERAFLINVEVRVPGASLALENADANTHTAHTTLFAC